MEQTPLTAITVSWNTPRVNSNTSVTKGYGPKYTANPILTGPDDELCTVTIKQIGVHDYEKNILD
ncbi:752_t:CDS:2 [Entrophospora sp. SA101]|nr:752_t:CDS:2 [Entrophospora sp. SA101]